MPQLPTTPYWIDTHELAEFPKETPVRLAIVPCPPGGRQLAAAVRSIREQGIESLVSLLSAEEVRVLGLRDEERLCREAGIDFRWFPVDDHSIPSSMEEFRSAVASLQQDLRQGRGAGAHCFAGIGRSCMFLAGVLCAGGFSAEQAFARLSAARGLRVPDTWLQSQWVGHFAESLSIDSGPL